MAQTQATDGWFSENKYGMDVAVKLERHLCGRRSRFQQIDVYQTGTCGRMLVLDGVIQLTEFDEFTYQEMLSHIPLFAHPAPQRVLVIGGGDGGVLREIAKHDGVETIDLCEIDGEVVAVAKEFLPSLSCGFDDPRVTISIADGSEFVKTRKNFYDVIIVDSTDPAGPGEPLFNEQFYAGMKAALRENGIIASQSESLFLHRPLITRLVATAAKLFVRCAYAMIFVPTYPAGNIGACVASLGPEIVRPQRRPDAKTFAKLKYYTPELHEAAFVLPKFGRDMLEGLLK